MTDIARRKTDHLDLALSGDVGFKETTSLLWCVRLVHSALPELDLGSIDLGLDLIGKRLRAPLVIAGMTGGTDRGARINRDLAAVAEARGYAFGLGSQRAMLLDPSVAATFRVRDVAPTTLVLGNLGAVQAAAASRQQIVDLVGVVEADALCLHLNPAQELLQPDGDRDFRGCLDRIGELAREFPVPIVVKETGCGISSEVAARLRAAGVCHLDVSGAGGTSWVAIETQRSDAPERTLGRLFSEWGIPTAASVALVAPHGFETVIATGGIGTGLHVAQALALGAHAAGLARPVLQALDAGGVAAVHHVFDRIEHELRATMLLTGCARLRDLRTVPRVVTGELADWLRR